MPVILPTANPVIQTNSSSSSRPPPSPPGAARVGADQFVATQKKKKPTQIRALPEERAKRPKFSKVRAIVFRASMATFATEMGMYAGAEMRYLLSTAGGLSSSTATLISVEAVVGLFALTVTIVLLVRRVDNAKKQLETSP